LIFFRQFKLGSKDKFNTISASTLVKNPVYKFPSNNVAHKNAMRETDSECNFKETKRS